MPERWPCPCCGFLTLPEEPPGSLDLCQVCFWQDDSVGFAEPWHAVGANHISLNDARENFRRIGVSEERMRPHVRPPRPEEYPRASG
jgi:hypothetical protein